MSRSNKESENKATKIVTYMDLKHGLKVIDTISDSKIGVRSLFKIKNSPINIFIKGNGNMRITAKKNISDKRLSLAKNFKDTDELDSLLEEIRRW